MGSILFLDFIAKNTALVLVTAFAILIKESNKKSDK